MENEEHMGGAVQEKPAEPAGFKQEEIDRIVSERLKRERARWDKELQTEVSKARAEAAKMSSLTEREKAEHLLKGKESDLLKREQEIMKRELRAEGYEILRSYDLPAALIACMCFENEQALQKSAEVLKEAFYKAVDEGVNKRLVAKAPKVPNQQEKDPFLKGLKN